MVKSDSLVVITCIAYNQERYIRDALDGFIMQKTEFPYIAIVHDDASTDGTAEVIKEYAKLYPQIIKPIFETENQYSKGNGILGEIIRNAIKSSGAKYVAMCEGDDYWIDPDKLQKQVDFLESHPDYALCFHNVIIKSDNQQDFKYFNHLSTKEYTVQEIIEKWSVPTCSSLLKTNIVLKRPINHKFQYGDNVMWLTCARHGKMYCINEKMAVYRRNSGGWTSQPSFEANKKQVLHHEGLLEEFSDIARNALSNKLRYYMAITFISGIKANKLECFRYLKRGLLKYKIAFIVELFSILKSYLTNKIRQ